MAYVASIMFFAAAMGSSLWIIAAMLAQNGTSILRALRMEVAVEPLPQSPVRVMRRAYRPRSTMTPVEWRAAA